MEFKGTKGNWTNNDIKVFSYNEDKITAKQIAQCFVMKFEHDIRGRRIEDIEGKYNALLISKAPILLEEHQKEVEFLKSLLAKIEKYSLDNNAWDLDSNIERNLIEDRIKNLEQLIKKATEIQP